MTNSQKPRVAVIGGSIAGLSVGIALRCLGCAVQIYEQSSYIINRLQATGSSRSDAGAEAVPRA